MAAELASSGPREGAGDRRALGRYLLCEEIACGGMAAVHLGRLGADEGVRRVVAIKRLHPQFAKDPEFVAMFLDEARIAMRVRHANVASVLDLVARDGELFLIMEYLHGESLARLAREAASRGERIPPPIVAAIVTGVLHGLHAAHETTNERGEPLGIVHRDVSPQNVLVGVDGLARVLDFGVAKAAGRAQTTREGQVKGKLAYMSPEQILGHAVDRRADVYAAGVLAWEALAGRGLHHGDNQGVVLARVLAGAADAPSRYAPDLPAAWDDVVMKALGVEPLDRYETARAMAAAIEAEVACATPREVGEWVTRLAEKELARRSAALLAVERDEPAERAPVARDAETARAKPTPADVVTVVEGARARVAPRAHAAQPTRAYGRWALGAAMTLGALGAIAALVMRAIPTSQAEPSADRSRVPVAEPPATASAAPIEPASAAPIEAASAAPQATAPSAAPPASAPPRREARPAAPPRGAPKAATASSPTTAPGCDHPFVSDANGVLRVRRECL